MNNKNIITIIILILIYLSFNNNLHSEYLFYKNIDIIQNKDSYELSELFSDINSYSIFNNDVHLIKIKILFEQKKYNKVIDYSNAYIQKITEPNVLDLINFYTGISYFNLKEYKPAVQSLLKITEYTHLKTAYLSFVFFYINSISEFEFYKNIFFSLPENNNFILLYSLVSYLDIINTYNNQNHLMEEKYYKYKPYLILFDNIFTDSFKLFFSALVNTGKYNAVFNEIMELEKTSNPQISYYKGFLYLKKLNFKESKLIFNSILESEDLDIQLKNLVFLRLGQLHILSEDYSAAIDYLKNIESENEQLISEKNVSSAYAYYKLNQMEKAYSYFKKIRIENLHYYQKYFNDIIITAFNAEKYNKIIELFDEINLLKSDKKYLKDNLFYYMSALYHTEKYKKVVEIFNENNNIEYNAETLIIVGQANHKLNDNFGAIKILLKSAGIIKPKDKLNLIYEKIGDIYLEMNDEITALKYYKYVSGSVSASLKKADIYLNLKQYKLLLNLIDNFEEKSSEEDFISFQIYKYKCLMELERHAEAQTLLKPILEINKTFEIFYNILKSYYLNNRLDNFTDFLNNYKNIFIHDNRFKEALLLYADLLVKNRYYSKAINEIDKISEYYDVIPVEIIFKKTDCLRNLTRYNESNKLLYDLLNNYEMDIFNRESVYYRLALNYFYLNDNSETIKYLESIEKYYQDYVYYLYGDIFTNLKDFETANIYFNFILENYEESLLIDKVLYRTAILLFRENKYAEAEIKLLRIIDNYKNSIYYNRVLFILGYNCFQKNDFENAVSFLNKITDLDKTNFENDYYLLLSKTYAKMEQYEISLHINNKIIEKVDKFYKSILLFENAVYLSLLSRYEESNDILNNLIANSFINNDIYLFQLTDNYISLNDFTKAEETLNFVSDKESPDYKLIFYILNIHRNSKNEYYYLEDIDNKYLTYTNELRYIYVTISNLYYLNKDNEAKDKIAELKKNTDRFNFKIEVLRKKHGK